MGFDGEGRYDSRRYARQASVRRARPQRLIGGAALLGVAFACGWITYLNLAGGVDRIEVVGTRGDKLVMTRPRPAPTNSLAALFDPRSLGVPPGSFVKRIIASAAPVRPDERPGSNAPASAPVRQALSAAAPQPRAPQLRTAAPRESAPADRVAAPADHPSLFQRLFGKPSAPTLAYAAPDDGIDDRPNLAAGYDGQTAVYDIAAHTVYMPDGKRLEAHSGLGSFLDDPHYADVRNRGVTPPNVYDLELREGLFHGVRALRLIPADDAKVFGRSGLLAHSYMLGPNGDSNGCVSFRDYEAFLQAYLNHEVKRLVVVAGHV